MHFQKTRLDGVWIGYVWNDEYTYMFCNSDFRKPSNKYGGQSAFGDACNDSAAPKITVKCNLFDNCLPRKAHNWQTDCAAELVHPGWFPNHCGAMQWLAATNKLDFLLCWDESTLPQQEPKRLLPHIGNWIRAGCNKWETDHVIPRDGGRECTHENHIAILISGKSWADVEHHWC